MLTYRRKMLWSVMLLSMAALSACRGTITTTGGNFPTVPAGQQISLQGLRDLVSPYQLFSLHQALDGGQVRLFFAAEPRQSPYNETYTTIDSIRVDGSAPMSLHLPGSCTHDFTMTGDGAHFLCTDGQRLVLTGADGTRQQLALTAETAKSVAITSDGAHLAVLSQEDAGNVLTIADLALTPLSFQPRLRLVLPVVTAEDVYPVVSWSPDGRWLMLHRENQLLFFKTSDLRAAFASSGVLPPTTLLDYAMTTILPASAAYDKNLSVITWGVRPDEVIVTDSQHLKVAALNVAQQGGSRQLLDLSPLQGSVMVHQMTLSADGQHLYGVVGYPYYGFNDANPAPYNPPDRLYAFAQP